MSIRCNPGAPREVPESMTRQHLATAPDTVELEERVKDSPVQLRHDYGPGRTNLRAICCRAHAGVIPSDGHSSMLYL